MEDSPFYSQVAEELRNGHVEEGLWLKALVDADGDEDQAKLRYVRLRVAQLRDERRSSHAGQRGEHKKTILKDVGFFALGIVCIFFILYGGSTLISALTNRATGSGTGIIGFLLLLLGLLTLYLLYRKSSES